MYKIGALGSGVDYMYLDSSGGGWSASQHLVNTSRGALGRTLNQLYLGEAYQVRSPDTPDPSERLSVRSPRGGN